MRQAKRKGRNVTAVIAVAALFLVAGCSGTPLSTREKGTIGGAGIGAATGAIIGAAVGAPGAGAAIGAGLGGITGFAIGNSMQNQEASNQQTQSQVQQQQQEIEQQRQQLEQMKGQQETEQPQITYSKLDGEGDSLYAQKIRGNCEYRVGRSARRSGMLGAAALDS